MCVCLLLGAVGPKRHASTTGRTSKRKRQEVEEEEDTYSNDEEVFSEDVFALKEEMRKVMVVSLFHPPSRPNQCNGSK